MNVSSLNKRSKKESAKLLEEAHNTDITATNPKKNSLKSAPIVENPNGKFDPCQLFIPAEDMETVDFSNRELKNQDSKNWVEQFRKIEIGSTQNGES